MQDTDRQENSAKKNITMVLACPLRSSSDGVSTKHRRPVLMTPRRTLPIGKYAPDTNHSATVNPAFGAKVLLHAWENAGYPVFQTRYRTSSRCLICTTVSFPDRRRASSAAKMARKLSYNPSATCRPSSEIAAELERRPPLSPTAYFVGLPTLVYGTEAPGQTATKCYGNELVSATRAGKNIVFDPGLSPETRQNLSRN